MPDQIKLQPLRSLLEACWPGEWGKDPVGDQGSCVVYRATDIDDDGHLRLEGGAERSVLTSKLAAKSLRPNDILLEASGGAPDRPVGRVALVSKPPRKAALTSNFFRLLRPKNTVDARFLTLQLVALNRSSAIWRYQQQTTGLINLKVADYLGHAVWTPALDTQRKIADLFDCIDTAIERTEALIAKHQRIKAGLMHDLFTRGLLPNGRLRAPRSEAQELYQRTALGWIPKDWSLHRCADLCTRICVGIVIQPTQYYVDEGVPALRSANVREEGIDPSNFVYISAYANRSLVKSQLKAGDIVSVRTGYPGTSAVVPHELEGANCIDILISTPGERVSSNFLCDWINSSFGKEQVLRQQGGMAQQHFNVGEMRELLVALPSLDEQDRIREKLSSVTQTLVFERARAEKYRAQKLGLMQDLLTGRVSVKHLVPEPANA
jgi:type I restriction enzyme S subunit